MEKAIIGRKVGMTQVFMDDGRVEPVTVIEAGPCYVSQIKTQDVDGYNSVQLAFGEVKAKNVNKSQAGTFKKAGIDAKRVLKEFRYDDVTKFALGQEIKADMFKEGDLVDVSGTSKGHGFSGVIKRWNHHRLKMTHGVGPVHREVGSMGANSTPSRVFKGKKMPGQYGNEAVTIQNLKVVRVDADRNLILVKGAIPGPKKSIVTIKSAVKA
ncbi:MAG TPA: 50S ribosomal protein L3 [Candidatus Onthoplasma faecipullorum]|nr:50S ribosomal protein L3 [Candidatus Onthoplasma faecipullorum]